MIAYILLLSHALGDFIFQWKSLVENKVYNPETKNKFVFSHITHILIHSITITLFLLIFDLSYSSKIFWIILVDLSQYLGHN